MRKRYGNNLEKEKRRNLKNKTTFCERIVWLHLKKEQLGYKFLRHNSVNHLVIDFYCPKLKLAVQINNEANNLTKQTEKNIAIQKYLEKFKITFVRITNKEFLKNPGKAFRKIEDAIKIIEKITKWAP